MKHEEIVIGTNKIITQKNLETGKLEYRHVPVEYKVIENNTDGDQVQSLKNNIISSMTLINLKLRAVTRLVSMLLELSDVRKTYPLGNYKIGITHKDMLTVTEPNSGRVVMNFHKTVARKLQMYLVEEFIDEASHSVGGVDASSTKVLLEILYGGNTPLPEEDGETIDSIARTLYDGSELVQEYLKHERPNPTNRNCGYLEHSYHFEGNTVYSSVEGVRVTSSIMDRELLLDKLDGSCERIRDLDSVVQEFEDIARSNTIVIQVCRALNVLSSATISTPDVRYVIYKTTIGDQNYLALDSGGLRIAEVALDTIGYLTIVRLVEYLTKPKRPSDITDKNASLLTLFFLRVI